MRRKEYAFIPFFLFFFLSLIVFFIGKTGLFSPLEKAVSSMGVSYSVVLAFKSLFGNHEIKRLRQEKALYTKKLVDISQLQKENQALKDQFQTTFPKSLDLIPARIIGVSKFIPGVSFIESFTLNIGDSDGVKKGAGVVYKDQLVGEVVQASRFLSRVDVITNKNSSFAAYTLSLGKPSALGVIKGRGNGEMILDNVLLSEALSIGDVVVTKGDIDQSSTGFSNGLIIGTIVSVDKKPSALFQMARVKSGLDFSGLSTVFVQIGK